MSLGNDQALAMSFHVGPLDLSQGPLLKYMDQGKYKQRTILRNKDHIDQETL